MTEQERAASLPELLRFFAPLAVTWMLMMFTHTIISAGLARTSNPTIATAAYAIALSFGDIFEAPLVMIRQTGIAFITGRESFQTVRQVTLVTIAVFMVIVSAIAYIPPLTRFTFQNILGVTDDLYTAAVLGFRVTMFFPLVSGLRSLYQSVILVNRRTIYISLGVIVRVIFVALVVYGLVRTGLVPGVLVGAIAIVGAVLAEAIPAYHFGSRLLQPDTGTPIAKQTVWRFYLPLIASSLFVTMGKPFINAGLTRMPQATVSLAAFSVASSLAGILISPSHNIHQLTMVFGRSRQNLPLVRKFAISFSLLTTGLLLLVSFSPLGTWILTGLINIPQEMLAPTQLALSVLTCFPLLIGWLEYNTGILLLNQATGIISLGKTLNLLGTIAFVLLLASRLPGPIAAPLAQVVGLGCEGLVLQVGMRYLGTGKSRSRPARQLGA